MRHVHVSKIKTVPRKSSNEREPYFPSSLFPSLVGFISQFFPVVHRHENTRSYVELAWGCGRISEQRGLRLEDTTVAVSRMAVWKDVYTITGSVSFFRKKKKNKKASREGGFNLHGRIHRASLVETSFAWSVYIIRIYPMINTPVSAPVYQIYLRGDDNEGLRSKRAFSLWNENGKMLEGFYSLYFTFSMYRSKFKEGR